jgi:hypothetical protein
MLAVTGNDEQSVAGWRQRWRQLSQRPRSASRAPPWPTGADTPKTKAELYEIAKQCDLPGRSKMGRDELARKLGEK